MLEHVAKGPSARCYPVCPDMPDISALIQRWQTGDDRAAKALYNHCREPTFRLACGLPGDRAEGHYAQAAALALRRVVLLDEWATFRWYSWRDEARACELLERSLELDPEFEQTQQQYAEVCWREFPDQPQNLDFEE
jgi:hypothetical protein